MTDQQQPEGLTAIEVIHRLGQGDFVTHLAEAITEVAEQVLGTGQKGAVTVTFSLEQAGAGDPAVIVKEAIQVKPPKQPGQGMMVYVGDHELLLRDPRQVPMPFRSLDEDEREPVDLRQKAAGRTREASE